MNQSAVKSNPLQTEKYVPRTGRELFKATVPFAEDDKVKSWNIVITTFGFMICLTILSAFRVWFPLRLAFSIGTGLVMIRAFTLYHDYLHGAILRGSKLAKAVFYTYGVYLLTPPNAWRKSHNYHHAHVGHIEDTHVGSYPIWSIEKWKNSGFWARLYYRINRNPITIMLGYLTVFIFNLCILPIIENFSKHKDGLFTLIFHGAFITLVWKFIGLDVLILAYILPISIAAALGSYLFYVQHNMEGMNIFTKEEWSFEKAALESSSYLKVSPLMNWISGNIGYHHVHHLNSRIPLYRLPEAMAAIPELNNSPVVTLDWANIVNSFRLKIWDPDAKKMIGFQDLKNY